MDLERVGPYRIERKLGQGGMGVVYAAWDERLERRVALKQIRPEIAKDSLRARFRREAKVVAQLDHPSIVRIHDLLETPEGDWIVLQYVEGPSLAQRLKEGPLPPTQVAALARDVLGALDAAHSRGLLHRDLKTENVVLSSSGRALVLDFGLAKLYAPSSGANEATLATEGIVGTYRAMSPEQANGFDLDPRSDLFSLGVLLYEAATGVSPFQGATPVATLALVCTHLQKPARERSPAVPEGLSALIDALLDKNADRRPQSADAALARLNEIGTAGEGRPPTPVDEEPTLFDDPHRQSSPLPVISKSGSIPSSSATPYRSLRFRQLPLLAGLVVLAAVGVLLVWQLRVVEPSQAEPAKTIEEPLYVVVARPEIGLGAEREEVILAAAALQAGSLRALTALEGVAALSPGKPEPGDPHPTVQRLSRLLAAKEAVTASLDCQPRQCQIVLRRQRGSDGKILAASAPFEIPLGDLHLLDTAAAAYLTPLFAEFRGRTAVSPLEIRSEDYPRFLKAQRQWEEERPADLKPLLAELDQIRQGSPQFLDSYLLEARILGNRFYQTRDAKDLERALDLLTEAERLAPADPLPLVTRASVGLSSGRLDDAESALLALEKRFPGELRALDLRALLMENQGAPEKALELMRSAVARRPAAALMASLANLELRQGEIPAARRTLEALLARVPQHNLGESLLAQLELEAGSLKRAVELYSGLARRNPGIAVYSNLGLSQMLLGRYAEAADNLRRAYALSPKSYAALLNLADIEYLSGRKAEAAKLYQQSLDLMAQDPDPENWQLLAAKAQAQAHLGRKTEAAASIQKAVVTAPNNPDVAFAAALVYCVIGDHASALANADRALNHGFNRRWFALAWFEPLRGVPAFRELAIPSAAEDKQGADLLR